MIDQTIVAGFQFIVGFLFIYAIIIGNYRSIFLIISAAIASIVSVSLAATYGMNSDAYIQSAFRAMPIGGVLGCIFAIYNASKSKSMSSRNIGGISTYQPVMGNGLPKKISYKDKRLSPRTIEEEQSRQHKRTIYERLDEMSPATPFRSGAGRKAEIIYQELKYGSLTESQAREQVGYLVGRQDADAVFNEMIEDWGNR